MRRGRRGEDFNYWPAFTDLMLTLTLMLIVVLGLIFISAGGANIDYVKERQEQFVAQLGERLGAEPTVLRRSETGSEYVLRAADFDVTIVNELSLQRVTFSGQLLFASDAVQLSSQGEAVLRVVASAIRLSMDHVREIQIQGHADTDPSALYDSNVELAAMRSIEVYGFLASNGVDPATVLMSATSFGEYKPVARGEDVIRYSRETLVRHNCTEEQRDANRRVELLLFYRL